MLEVCNHFYFTGVSKNKFLEEYKYIIFDTNDKEIAKKIFELRFLKDVPKIKIYKKTEDPIVADYQKLGYKISYTFNHDLTENYDNVLIDVPSIDINSFEFLQTEYVSDRNTKDIMFISKYQILWDKNYIDAYKKLV
jgi:hypothetical protein